MRRNFTLRTQLSILLALIVLFQSVVLVVALSVSGVFFMLDAEAIRLLNNTTESRMKAFNHSIGELVSNLAGEAELLNQTLTEIAHNNDRPLNELFIYDNTYDEVALAASNSLVPILKNNKVTGAFFILNGSNSNKENANFHSAVYIRNTTPEKSEQQSQNYVLEVGPAFLLHSKQMTASIRWNLDMNFSEMSPNADFYTKPIWAVTQYRNAERERYGYWSNPMDLFQDNQKVICYTMPLYDENKECYGVIGIELSLPFFTQTYLPFSDLLYHNSFYAVTGMYNDTVFEWVVPGGPLAQTYLRRGDSLKLDKIEDGPLYATNLSGLGALYCSVQTLTVYSANSPFFDQEWKLLCFVPQEELQENSSGVRHKLLITILLITAIAFCIIFLLVYLFTRRISGLSKYVTHLSPYDDIRFERTGMREIDDLTSAVTMFSQRFIEASKTVSKILDLTLLPIGGYEVSDVHNHVILTEFLYKLLHLPSGALISKSEWELYFLKLTRQPMTEYENVYMYYDKPMMEYENVFLYYDETSDSQYWLRILENRTTTERIGVVLDITKDVEENRRLLQKLEYDTLTPLYNRDAFIRLAKKRIQEEPEKVGAMLFFDLDNLKYINDTFGHDIGDYLIIRAGEFFQEFSQHKGIVSRISGDEFAVYLHGYDFKEEIRELIAQQFGRIDLFKIKSPDGEYRHIRFSCGLAWYPDDAKQEKDLLKYSDFAMYEAKHKQKGTLFEFNPDDYQKTYYLFENRDAINLLLDEELIQFACQPIVNLKTGETYGYELLMRPLLDNFNSPMEILAVAAAQSKLYQLERLVFFKAFQMIHENSVALESKQIFINSIASQILSEDDLLILKQQYQHIFQKVVVEITEDEHSSSENLKQKVRCIREQESKLAIDDYGSGNFNEIRIISASLDILKIDMKLIQGIHQNQDKQKLVCSLVDFCHKNKVAVVAEGVENYLDLVTLVQMDIDYAQGYYIGKPKLNFSEVSKEAKESILQIRTGHVPGIWSK